VFVDVVTVVVANVVVEPVVVEAPMEEPELLVATDVPTVEEAPSTL